MNNKLNVFINKQKVPKGEKPSYFSKLFSSSLWAPRIGGVKLSSPSEAVHEANVAELSVPDYIKPEPVLEAVQKPIGETPKEIIAPKIEVKVEIKVEKSAPKELSSVLFDGDFSLKLAEINNEWKVQDISGIDDFSGAIDILFYGLDEIEKNLIPELVPISLIESNQDLLGKMIGAMELKQGEFVRFPRFLREDSLEVLSLAISYFKPKVVVTLGAAATNEVVEKKVKLTSVHGQIHKKIFKINGEDFSVDISPLFHPQLLEINQSMKRTAWLDMKKLIDLLD